MHKKNSFQTVIPHMYDTHKPRHAAGGNLHVQFYISRHGCCYSQTVILNNITIKQSTQLSP